MILSNYEGPADGDYVAYVDKLMRSSPSYCDMQSSVAQARHEGAAMSSGQSAAQSAASRKAARPKASASAGEAAPSTARSAPRGSVKERTKAQPQPLPQSQPQPSRAQRQAAAKATPWVAPIAPILIVAGMVFSQFASGFGRVLLVLGLVSLAGGVIGKLKSQFRR